MSDEASVRDEIVRMKRVADQLCTAHAALAQRYSLWALLLDLSLLFVSAWLAAMAFVDPAIAPSLTPLPVSPTIWIGILSVSAFCLSLFQLRADWKGRGEAHRRGLEIYAEVKREAGYLLASTSQKISPREFLRVASRYDMASDVAIAVPEAEFLRQKQRHLVKVELSRTMDARPAVFLPLEWFKLFIRDNGKR